MRLKSLLTALYHYMVFFFIVAFVITCSTMLFVNVLAEGTGMELNADNIGPAAKLTFLNTALISLIFTVIDSIRRHITVAVPVRHISEAAERMIGGDFSIRIPRVSRLVSDDAYNEIIDCMNKMAEELSGVETLRTDFIANVSHEMKTPLAVIQNYAACLRAPELTPEKRLEYAGAIGDASRRLADMMTNILKLNRLENQQIFRSSERFDLGEQLCECLLCYEKVWESRGIDIKTDIEEEVFIRADSELLSLVWNNLLSNAFKFTEEGGCVSVSLRSEGDIAEVRIADTGCGMSPEVGAHIFEKFYQGDTSHATQGNGLGLALVRRVVDILHAEIAVESEVGIGTTFTVRLGRNTDEIEKTA